jgi:hypothetical protein
MPQGKETLDFKGKINEIGMLSVLFYPFPHSLFHSLWLWFHSI